MKGESIPDMFGKIGEESTMLGKIASKIPGFSGYMEKSRRRAADDLLRGGIADRLETIRLELANVQADISSDIIMGIEHATSLGSGNTLLTGLIGKLRAAPVGYAGLFDAQKIKEDDLARIYSFDESMLSYVDELVVELDAMKKGVLGKGDVGGTIREFVETLRQATNTFNARNQFILGTTPE